MCTGFGYKAWELAPDGAIAFKKVLENMLTTDKKFLARLKAGKFETLSEIVQVRKEYGFVNENKTYDKGTDGYARLQKEQQGSTEWDIRSLTYSIKELTTRIANWKAEALKYGGAETQPRWKSRMLNKS